MSKLFDMEIISHSFPQPGGLVFPASSKAPPMLLLPYLVFFLLLTQYMLLLTLCLLLLVSWLDRLLHAVDSYLSRSLRATNPARPPTYQPSKQRRSDLSALASADQRSITPTHMTVSLQIV
eukprot:g60658.t1